MVQFLVLLNADSLLNKYGQFEMQHTQMRAFIQTISREWFPSL